MLRCQPSFYSKNVQLSSLSERIVLFKGFSIDFAAFVCHSVAFVVYQLMFVQVFTIISFKSHPLKLMYLSNCVVCVVSRITLPMIVCSVRKLYCDGIFVYRWSWKRLSWATLTTLTFHMRANVGIMAYSVNQSEC